MLTPKQTRLHEENLLSAAAEANKRQPFRETNRGLVRRLSRAVQAVRDAVMLVFSLGIVGSTYGKWANDQVFLLVFPLGAALLVLTLVNIALVIRNAKRKGYFYANAIVQLPILLVFAGLLGPLGLILLVADVAVLATLPERKSPEDLLKRPPLSLTRNYRIVVGVGLLTMLASMFLPWLATLEASDSLFGIYAAIASHSTLPALTLSPALVLFALMALLLSPVSLVLSALGMIRRRFSLVAGVLGVLAGSSMLIVLTSSVGPGAYGFILGGVVVLAGYFGFK